MHRVSEQREAGQLTLRRVRHNVVKFRLDFAARIDGLLSVCACVLVCVHGFAFCPITSCLAVCFSQPLAPGFAVFLLAIELLLLLLLLLALDHNRTVSVTVTVGVE